MIDTLTRGWRPHLEDLVRSARHHLLVASPFIKVTEAGWLRAILPPRTRLKVITDVRAQAVADGALDVHALPKLASTSEGSEVVTLPGLHAKVYVADCAHAIVTSGNLTKAGLDRNYEYGIGLHEEPQVAAIRRDLETYARLGNVLDAATLVDLVAVADDLVAEGRRARDAQSSAAQRAFEKKLRGAAQRFAAARLGSRSSNAMFGEALRFVLADRPRSTAEIGPEVQRLLPDLCDDEVELVIGGERYGKDWKHRLRNAQQQLKRAGVVEYSAESRTWRLVE